MEQEQNIDPAIMAEYLSGDVSLADSADVEQWAAGSPERKKVLFKLREIWSNIGLRPKPEADFERMIAAVEKHARESLERSGAFMVKGRKWYSGGILPRWVGYGAAAAGALTFVVTLTLWRGIQPGSAPHSDADKVYNTRLGQRASLTLDDGSRVVLGPATTLRISSSERPGEGIAAEVTGEALFSITHSAKEPFTVVSHGVTTRVLGTEFIVRGYDASNVKIAVRDGRVSVHGPLFTSNNTSIVNAGEIASVAPNSLPKVMPIQDLATEFSWANGELVLRDITLGEALTRISRWYGMDFRVADSSLLRDSIGVILPSSFNQSDIAAIARSVNAVVIRSGNSFIFTRKQ